MRNLFSLSQKTLRVRLTAWYILLLGLTLLIFSSYIYLQVQHSLLDRVDYALRVAAEEVLGSINPESDALTFSKTQNYQDTARCLSRTGFSARFINSEGKLGDSFGKSLTLPVPKAAGFMTLKQDGATKGADEHWRVYSQQLRSGQSIWLQTIQPLGELNETLEDLLTQILLGLPIVLGLATWSGFFLANRALQPIDRITRTARSISAHDLSQRMQYRGPADEVGQLAITFDQMLDRLQSAFERERRFTADASHELRTPLTVIKGQIGVTLSQFRHSTEYISTLEALEQAVNRLIRLTNDMLYLARLDQGQQSWQPETLNLSQLLAGATSI
jgi:HAMP domain-containing protein